YLINLLLFHHKHFFSVFILIIFVKTFKSNMGNIGIQLKWAAIITLFACVWAAIEKALGYHEDFSNIMFTAFLYFVLITFLWAFAYIDKKKSLGKDAIWEFKNAFKF